MSVLRHYISVGYSYRIVKFRKEYHIIVDVEKMGKSIIVHKETNIVRAEGVFSFLIENSHISTSFAKELIEQRAFKHGERWNDEKGVWEDREDDDFI